MDWSRWYLDLLMATLTGLTPQQVVKEPQEVPFVYQGRRRPPQALTMIGYPRLWNLESALRDLHARDIPGDVLEAGVWKGGACLYMKAVLRVLGDTTRTLWLADSFHGGFPEPDRDRYPADAPITIHRTWRGQTERGYVETMFRGYGLMDDRVKFLEGWFEETLPRAPIERLALLRCDGDMYSSTRQTLECLYDKVSVGGYVIMDDYGCIEQSRQATDDFRRARGIVTPMQTIDWAGAYWIKEAA